MITFITCLLYTSVDAKGDIEIDDHHTIEDVGILLGEAFRQAIGDKRGIKRMADATVPMDESVAKVAIDISGRSYCNMEFDFTNEKIGDMTSEIVVHFFEDVYKRQGIRHLKFPVKDTH